KGATGIQGPQGIQGPPGASISVSPALIGSAVLKVLTRMYSVLRRMNTDLVCFYGVGPDMRTATDADLYAFMIELNEIKSDMTSGTASFTIDQLGATDYGYFALPTRFLASADLNILFKDVGTGLYGGWDGMQADPLSLTQSGPRVFGQSYKYDVGILEFSMFRTDYPGLQETKWVVSTHNT